MRMGIAKFILVRGIVVVKANGEELLFTELLHHSWAAPYSFPPRIVRCDTWKTQVRKIIALCCIKCSQPGVGGGEWLPYINVDVLHSTREFPVLYLCIGNMGKRKFRLHRKKRFSRQTKFSLMVSLPHPLSKWDILSKNIKEVDLGSWSWICTADNDKITISKFNSSSPPVALMTVTIFPSNNWTLHVGHTCLSTVETLPQTISSVPDVLNAITAIENCNLCTGIKDDKFTPLIQHHKGEFHNLHGDKVAYFDDIQNTIRRVDCALLLDSSTLCCSQCKMYQRNTLNRLLYRLNNESKADKENNSSHVNYRFMDSASKDLRMKKLQVEVQSKTKKIKRLDGLLQRFIQEESIPVDNGLHSDLLSIMNQHLPPSGTTELKDFKEIFWRQQLQAFAKKNPKSVRWHPLVVKWCLYLHHKSSGAYETLRNTGVIRLPSGRTLRDYRHFAPVTSGLSSATDKQLRDLAIKTSPLANHVVILIDEMYVRGGLVFNKSSGAIVGFVDIGDLNNHFIDVENFLSKKTSKKPLRPLAKTLLVFMVRGVVTSLIFPYALYPAASLRGCDIFPLLWDVIERLTRNNFHVMAVTCDGATCNRSLFRLHSAAGDVVYKTKNVYSTTNESIYFISDPPHLLKTIRNCFANSKRSLWCQGREISWRHVVNLYDRNMGAATGLCMIPKIKYEHIFLGAFSKMRVDLAAQVMSSSVAEAMFLTGGSAAFETAYFIKKVDQFFDCLNVRSYNEGKRKRKPFLQPYRSENDFRLNFLRREFLPYIHQWEQSVAERPGYTDEEKKRMLISEATLTGIKLTVKSFLELVPKILKLQDVSFFLSCKLNQDPLENFFGCVRQYGGVNSNPTILEAMKSTQSLRVINLIKLDGFIKGNCRGRCKRKLFSFDDMDLDPLPKRKRPSGYI